MLTELLFIMLHKWYKEKNKLSNYVLCFTVTLSLSSALTRTACWWKLARRRTAVEVDVFGEVQTCKMQQKSRPTCSLHESP